MTPLTPSQLAAYVAEVERRFRERTPSTDVLSALPATRVGRGEMRSWFSDAFGREIDIWDVEDLVPLERALFRRLRREFPDERW